MPDNSRLTLAGPAVPVSLPWSTGLGLPGQFGLWSPTLRSAKPCNWSGPLKCMRPICTGRYPAAPSAWAYVGIAESRDWSFVHTSFRAETGRDKRHARRDADRRGAVGRRKTGAAGRQAVEVRRLDNRVSVASHYGRIVLVGLDEQDIRPVRLGSGWVWFAGTILSAQRNSPVRSGLDDCAPIVAFPRRFGADFAVP